MLNGLSQVLLYCSKIISLIDGILYLLIAVLCLFTLGLFYFKQRVSAIEQCFLPPKDNTQIHLKVRLEQFRKSRRYLLLVIFVYLLCVVLFNTIFFKNWLKAELMHFAEAHHAQFEMRDFQADLLLRKFVFKDLVISVKQKGYRILDLKLGHLNFKIKSKRWPWQIDQVDSILIQDLSGSVYIDRDFKPEIKAAPIIAKGFLVRSAVMRFYYKLDPMQTLRIDEWKSKGFRFQESYFSTLYLSTIKGKLERKPFFILHEELGDHHYAYWHATGLPAKDLKYFVLQGPLTWLSKGKVDLEVQHYWQDNFPKRIRSDWHIRNQELGVAVEDRLNRDEQLTYIALVRALNQGIRSFDLSLLLSTKKLDNDSLKLELGNCIGIELRNLLKQLAYNAVTSDIPSFLRKQESS